MVTVTKLLIRLQSVRVVAIFVANTTTKLTTINQSQKQSLYPRAPLKSLENPLMFGSSFCTKNLEIVTIGLLVKF